MTLLEDTCENHRLALPNKAFEYIAAGLPVVASDLPELRRLVDQFGIGWTADPADPASIAAALRSALESRDDAALRERLAAAAEQLSWRREHGPPHRAVLLPRARPLERSPAASADLRSPQQRLNRCEALAFLPVRSRATTRTLCAPLRRPRSEIPVRGLAVRRISAPSTRTVPGAASSSR